MVLQKYFVSLYSMESPEICTNTIGISELEKQKNDNHFLTQSIQELNWESEQKDRIIDDLQTVIGNLKSRLRNNNLNDDVRLCEEEIKQDTHSYQNIRGLLETVRLTKSIQSSLENDEYLEQLIKENERYKNTITDLQIRLHSSNTPTNSFHKLEYMSLQHDIQEFSQKCQQMSQKLMAYEKSNFSAISNFNVIEENKKLRNKISEVQQANKKWRSYNNQRETFVRKLISEINSKKETSGNSTLSKSVQNNYEEVKKNEEELLALKTQVKIYAEDFESERKDREKAQSRISDLESEILKLKPVRDSPHDQQFLRSYTKGSKYLDQKEPVSRGISENPYVNQAYQKDAIEPVRKRADKFETDSVSNTKQNFICPSCNMVFGSDKQAELLAHVDLCF